MKLSLVVTAFMRPEPLEWTLASIAEQTRLPDELVICDDSPTDAAREHAEKFRSSFPNFRYHHQPSNLGMPGNLNWGIRNTQGEYVANLHDADSFHPTLLEKWEKALDTNPEAGFVFCGNTSHGDGTERTYLHPCDPYTPGPEFYRQHFAGNRCSLVRGTVMARRSIYETLNYFDDKWGVEADVEMWMRICSIAGVAYVNEPLQYCHAGYLNRSIAIHRQLNYYAMLDSTVEQVFPGQQDVWREVRNSAIQNRRKRFLRLAISQMRKGHPVHATNLFYWAMRRKLGYL